MFTFKAIIISCFDFIFIIIFDPFEMREFHPFITFRILERGKKNLWWLPRDVKSVRVPTTHNSFSTLSTREREAMVDDGPEIWPSKCYLRRLANVYIIACGTEKAEIENERHWTRPIMGFLLSNWISCLYRQLMFSTSYRTGPHFMFLFHSSSH